MSNTPMTDKTREKIAKGIAKALRMPAPVDGEVYYLLQQRMDAILAIPEIEEGQKLREKAKSGKSAVPHGDCVGLSYHSAGRNQEGWYHNWAACANNVKDFNRGFKDWKCPEDCDQYEQGTPASKRREYH